MTPYEKKYNAVVGKMFWKKQSWWQGENIQYYYQLLFISGLGRKYNKRFQYRISLLKEVDENGITLESSGNTHDYSREASRFHDVYHRYIPVVTGVPLEDMKLHQEKINKKAVDSSRSNL